MAISTYSSPGSYNFTLPISTGITIRIAGAAGGTGGTDGGPPAIVGGVGGEGRYGVFTLPDYSYGDFTFVVGGAGGNGGNSGTSSFNGGSGGSSATSAGGGGQEDSPSGSSGGGAGGGGASSATFNNAFIAIAGGGGGGGGGTAGATSNITNQYGTFRTDGEDGDPFSASTSSPSSSDVSNATGSTTGTGGDGGGAGGGGGGYPAGARGSFPGNDSVHPSEGGYAGGSFYRSDVLSLSSQSVYTTSTNGNIEIEYTAVSFDQTDAVASTAGPYYNTGPISFSSIRSNFRAQQRKTSGGGSETFITDNNSVSASGFLRTVSTSVADPIVPNCQENSNIAATASNWRLSQFRGSIKFFYLTQDSSKTSLNYQIHGQPWNSNLTYNIVKTMFIEGTCGSITSAAAATFDAESYNLHIHVLGSIQGDGGSAGTVGVNGGDGGDALYINSNGAGTVTVKTGSSAQVYGGGGGGGYGGEGGTGGTGKKLFEGSHYWANTGCVGNNMPCQYDPNFNSPIPCDREKCNNWGSCGDGINYTLWQRECWDDYSYYEYYPGGAGGDGINGGLGQGYLQTRTLGSGPNAGESKTGAGNGGDSGVSGNGGDWGDPGGDGTNGDPGVDSNHTDGTNGENGTLGGAAGRAIAGSGYIIDTSSNYNAYIGQK